MSLDTNAELSKFKIMKKEIKFYNIIFPVWSLFLIPMAWLIILPANFIIDSLVFLGAMAVFKIADKKNKYLKCIFRIWVFGLLADIIGSGLMFLALAFDYVDYGTALNPLASPGAFLFTSVGVVVAGACIYLFNYKWVLPLILIDRVEIRKIALTIAIFTAPYTMYIPATFFY